MLGKVYYWAGVNIKGLDNLKDWMQAMEKKTCLHIKGVNVPKKETANRLVKGTKKIIQT